jgi:hypothetical protein
MNCKGTALPSCRRTKVKKNENVAGEGIRLQRHLLHLSSGSSDYDVWRSPSRGAFDSRYINRGLPLVGEHKMRFSPHR